MRGESDAGLSGTETMFALAYDYASVRTYDVDGRLRVSRSNISRACVNPYNSREIPGWEALGLDAGKTYRLLRPADELRKAAPSFANVPLLDKHLPVDAVQHHPESVIGCIGTDVRFEDPYLVADLIVWAQPAIDLIESGERESLSCGYRYRPVMEPGTYRGEPYEGLMVDLVGNHVAVVPEGRAGPDVVVGDGALPRIVGPRVPRIVLPRVVMETARERRDRFGALWT
jgi:hypothetical protein